MEFLEKYNIKPMAILKITGIALLAIIVLAFALRLIGTTLNTGSGFSKNLASPSFGGAYDNDMAYEESTQSFKASDSIGLSTRNVSPEPPINGNITTGDNSEDFEVTQYNVTIETRTLQDDCKKITDLKAKDYVIFENANEFDRGCNYTFKVKRENKDEVMAVIEGMDPKNLTENTQTIKRLVDDFTSEMEILNRKKESIETTLEDAINSYDEISRVATQARDAESLAKIIDSKVRIIEKLSQERININTQLDRIARQKADQLDRLDYTYFYLNIYENKFVDGEVIKDSWKNEVKRFVRDINSIVQDSSIGLITLVFFIIQYSLYLLVILFTVRFGWKITKFIWNK